MVGRIKPPSHADWEALETEKNEYYALVEAETAELARLGLLTEPDDDFYTLITESTLIAESTLANEPIGKWQREPDAA